MLEQFNEILKLKAMLDDRGIPYEFYRMRDGYQLCYPNAKPANEVCSVIERRGSYGAKFDTCEIMGLLTEDEAAMDRVAGFLSANEVFRRIETHWLSTKGE